MKKYLVWITLLFLPYISNAQSYHNLNGKVFGTQYIPLEMALVRLDSLNLQAFSDQNGEFQIQNIPAGNHLIDIQFNGYSSIKQRIQIPSIKKNNVFLLKTLSGADLQEITVSTGFIETGKDDTPIAIDLITPQFFRKSNLPTLMDAASLVNGVRPNINCNVCNTGDIHINGMEGPYTLILIDGMPLVSGLSSVYGLSGIPLSMIERLEIAKGPASALYGSEAMGGIINVITKKNNTSQRFFGDYSITSYLENNLDIGTKLNLGKKTNAIIGINSYWYNKPHDINKDGFTDITQQKRISAFTKLNFERSNSKEFSVGGRFVYENRWGGETNWNSTLRGTDSIYAESIYTKRAEFFGKYDWPGKELITTQMSYVYHEQDSYYGTTSFMAKQHTGFFQTYWNKSINERFHLLSGISLKQTFFDDNTILTADNNGNKPEIISTPGIFIQAEIKPGFENRHHLLLGFRNDYHPVYRIIPSPRIAYKFSPNYRNNFRINAGRGFRIVNVFTEDHASLTGARELVFTENIKPETSYNINISHTYKMPFLKTNLIIWDISAFYYYFQNKIIANYDADPDKVIYNNLKGHAYSRGGALQAQLITNSNWRFTSGITLTEVKNTQSDSLGQLVKVSQLKTPLLSGNIMASYSFKEWKFDLTSTYTGKQRLPILPNDYRSEYSPWYMLLNFQISKQHLKTLEFYAGVKNILNFIPKNPIMRPFDPFDKRANDPVNNPNAYTFDPTYNYAPIQGIKIYLGIRINLL